MSSFDGGNPRVVRSHSWAAAERRASGIVANKAQGGGKTTRRSRPHKRIAFRIQQGNGNIIYSVPEISTRESKDSRAPCFRRDPRGSFV
jgi:hypothetical protein